MAKSLTKAQLGELKGVLSGELSRLTSNARHMITHRVHEPDELPAETIDIDDLVNNILVLDKKEKSD